jgi:rhamnose transport system ATP-binding protein
VHQPDSGTLTVGAKEVTLHGPAAARAAGVAVIYQEQLLFPDLTVAENMFIGRQPSGGGRRIDRRTMLDHASASTRSVGRVPAMKQTRQLRRYTLRWPIQLPPPRQAPS